jgi:CubicO group peptidase (beta-lactamase class C family)
MRIILLLILINITLNLSAQLTPIQQSRLDELFKEWNKPGSPGAALGIIGQGKFLYTKGYGMADLEHDIPITDATIFYIGSVSKQFVTMCILLLEEQGKLVLDDRVQKYLPDFPEYGAPLTIRHFIHHTSGVRDNLTLWGLAGNDYLDHIDKEEMYQLIRRQKELNFNPGDRFLYSNSCYFMLGLIIEKVSGESLNDFAQKNIFKPLGMLNSFFLDDNTRIIRNRAFSYHQEKGSFKNQLMRYDLVGSGGVYSNVRDLFLWDQNFYRNRLGKGSQSLIDKMHTEGLLNNGKSSGYAFAVSNGTYRGVKTVSHGGALASYRSYLMRFPDQNTSIIILANATPIDIYSILLGVVDIVLEKDLAPVPVKEKSAQVNHSKEEEKFIVADVQPFTGSYYSEELDVHYQLTGKDSQLYYSIKWQKPVALHPSKPDLFNSDDGISLKFERNKQNQVTGFRVYAGRVTDLKFTKK